MNKISLPYGSKFIECTIKNTNFFEQILPNFVNPLNNPIQVINKALGNPIDFSNSGLFQKNAKVAIAINDQTRPVPNHILLPQLLGLINKYGINPKNICLYIATGTHQSVHTNEFQLILPNSIIEKFKVSVHDCDDQNQLIYIGLTKRNTPVWINRSFYETDIKIVIGNIEPHHFMGFSGGAKSAAIGLAGRETININHHWLVDPLCVLGNYEQNPMRQDVEEIGDMVNIDAALNVVLSMNKEIVHVFWGSPRVVMEKGIPYSKSICQQTIPRSYDLVIASPGGHPKDINLYQSQKAITHASLITKDNGVIILAAACPDGLGSVSYERYMRGMKSAAEVMDQFEKDEFTIGPHKAYQIARQLQRNKIFLVSDMDPRVAGLSLLTPCSNLKEALGRAFQLLPPNPHIAVLPYATNTIAL